MKIFSAKYKEDPVLRELPEYFPDFNLKLLLSSEIDEEKVLEEAQRLETSDNRYLLAFVLEQLEIDYLRNC